MFKEFDKNHLEETFTNYKYNLNKFVVNNNLLIVQLLFNKFKIYFLANRSIILLY